MSRTKNQSVSNSEMSSNSAIKEYNVSTFPAGYCGPKDCNGQVLYVEKLLDVKKVTIKGRARRLFLTKWMGYPVFKSTWEREHVIHFDVVKKYYEQKAADQTKQC